MEAEAAAAAGASNKRKHGCSCDPCTCGDNCQCGTAGKASEAASPASKRAKTDGADGAEHKDHKNAEAGSALRAAALRRWSLENVLKEKPSHKVVTLQHRDSVGEALQKFAKRKILSAPVNLAPSLEDIDETGSFLGILDVGSILKFFTNEAAKVNFGKAAQGEQKSEADGKEKEKEHENKAHEQKSHAPSFETLHEAASKVLNTQCNIVVGNDVDYIFNLNRDLPLWDVITGGFLQHNRTKTKGKHAPHVHRLAVFNHKGRVTDIVSQSDVIRFLSKHIGDLGDIRKQTVQQLGFCPREVVTVRANTPVIEAFHTMFDRHVTSVAVLDDHGAVIANLSNSDLRGLTFEEFKHLDAPIGKFLKVHEGGHSKDDERKEKGETFTSTHVLTVSAMSTFEEVLNALVSARVHRLYIVDKKNKPIGIVTLTDLLRVLVA